jgi:hypothetical protein
MTAKPALLWFLDARAPRIEHKSARRAVKQGPGGNLAAVLGDGGKPPVKLLLRTTDPVKLSWLLALLGDHGIQPVVLDTHMSILDGSIPAIPRRVMVREEELAQARRILREAGEVPADE